MGRKPVAYVLHGFFLRRTVPLSSIPEAWRKTVETEEHEKRIAELEARIGKGRELKGENGKNIIRN